MASDLIVTKILVPPYVTAPCPTRVNVEITNVGQNTAPFPFDVAIDIPQNAEGPVAPVVPPRWLEGEGGLGPNQARTVSFEIAFPCQPQALLRAIADYSLTVSNNLRSKPRLVIPVMPIFQVAWLETDLQIGLLDRTNGVITWNPPFLCPRATLVVLANIKIKVASRRRIL